MVILRRFVRPRQVRTSFLFTGLFFLVIFLMSHDRDFDAHDFKSIRDGINRRKEELQQQGDVISEQNHENVLKNPLEQNNNNDDVIKLSSSVNSVNNSIKTRNGARRTKPRTDYKTSSEATRVTRKTMTQEEIERIVGSLVIERDDSPDAPGNDE